MAPTEVQRQILLAVVKRFLESWEPTRRRSLIQEFQDPESVDRLYDRGLIKTLDMSSERVYFPRSFAFHYCGNAEAEAVAKGSVQLIARVLKNQYLNDVRNLSVGNLVAEVREADAEVNPAIAVRLGLYLALDFNLLSGYTGGTRQQPEITPTDISEYIVTIKNTETMWDEFMARNIPWPTPEFDTRGVISIEEEKTYIAEGFPASTAITSRKVFVVHGHDHAAKEAVARFLEKLRLEAVVLHEQANKGRTLIEKFEAHSEDVCFAVVLLTPDDLGASSEQVSNDKARLNKRARQNVVFELGYFIGKLARRRVCALYVDGVELPSDMEGVLYIGYDQGGAWRTELAREIKAAGIEIDLNLLS